MTRVVLTLGIAALALGAFAVYTFGWHNNTGRQNEAAVAFFDARAMEKFTGGRHLRVVERATPGYWVARYGTRGSGEYCLGIRISRFSITDDRRVAGAAKMRCL